MTDSTQITDSDLPGEDFKSMLGRKIGEKYELVDLLGSGGYAAVFKAHQLNGGPDVALKLMHADLQQSETAGKRFKLEAKAVGRLEHPNIIRVFDYGITDANEPFIVMEIVEGLLLSELLEQGRMSTERAVGIFRQVCDAVEHAHERGIIHRDLKPSNVMLLRGDGRQDNVKLLDFGIARLLPQGDSDTRTFHTATGQVFGSPSYMSPEQCAGEHPDTRADIYIMGCLMYETLSGAPPFFHENPLEVVRMHLEQAPEPIGLDAKESDLERVVMKALAKEKEARFQTMAELNQALADPKSVKFDDAKKESSSALELLSKHKMLLSMIGGVLLLVLILMVMRL